jgi:hypothetical protein
VHPSVQGEKVKELFGDDVDTVYVSWNLAKIRTRKIGFLPDLLRIFCMDVANMGSLTCALRLTHRRSRRRPRKAGSMEHSDAELRSKNVGIESRDMELTDLLSYYPFRLRSLLNRNFVSERAIPQWRREATLGDSTHIRRFDSSSTQLDSARECIRIGNWPVE